MRKKVIALFLLLLLVLCGCTPAESVKTEGYSSKLADGEYTASAKYYNQYGYKSSIHVGIVKGLITSVSYTETGKTGVKRTDDTNATLNWDKTSYQQILASLYNAAIQSQGQSIDTVTGATKTSDDFKLLLSAALKQAESPSASPVVDSFSDVYTVQNEADPTTGSQETLTVTYTNGVITDVSCQEVTNNTAYYALGKTYASFAEISKKNKSIDDLAVVTEDPAALARYNALLKQVRDLRGQ